MIDEVVFTIADGNVDLSRVVWGTPSAEPILGGGWLIRVPYHFEEDEETSFALPVPK